MAKRKPELNDRASLLFNYGIDIETKTLYLGRASSNNDDSNDDVDAALAAEVIKGLHILDSIKPEEPLTIILNNEGGDIIHGFAIYDFIKSCKSQVVATVFGTAQSCGSIVLQAADHRVMSSHSSLMIHCGTAGVGPGEIVHNSHRAMAESDRLDQLMYDLYLEQIRKVHPEYSCKKLMKLMEWDTYLSPRQALELGLVDEILEN